MEGGTAHDEVLIAVDPHKVHNTLALIDPTTRTVVAEADANSHHGYGKMMQFTRRWRPRGWAVEGGNEAGRALSPFLVSSQDRW